MKISIIVPAYKAEQTIDRCVSSLVAQTYSDVEIILINDGSPDDTLTKCLAWAEKDKRVQVINQPHGGVSAARNNGLQHATGDYITFVDADDWVALEIYEKMMSAAISHEGADVVVCSFYFVSGKQIVGKNHVFGHQCLKNEGERLAFFLIKCLTHTVPEAFLLPSPVNKIYKSSVLKENSIRFDTYLSYAEDNLFNICFLKYAKNIVFIPDHLYYYDLTTVNSLSKCYEPYFFDSLIYSYKVFYQLFPAKYVEEEYYNNVRQVQTKALSLYARFCGLKGFACQARKIFEHEDLKRGYSLEYYRNKRKNELIPAFAIRHTSFALYLLWYYIINIILFAKHYVARILGIKRLSN